MNTAAHQIANGCIHEAVPGDGRQSREARGVDPDVKMATLPSARVTGVQRAVVANVEV